jgi:cell division protein FtsN
MGLMQLMPQTYEELRQRHGLGPDPYDPRDNILAGAAYLREMYDRYGAPAFLAAYNAGPHRLDDFLSGASPLPAETVNYVAAVGPRIGAAGTLGRPGARYAAAPGPTAEALNRQVLAGILRPGAPDPRPQPTAAPDPAVTALNRQVLASAAEPRSAARAQPDADADADDLNRRMLARLGDPAPAPRPALAVLPAPATAPRSLEHAAPSGRWGVQVGAFSSPGQAGAAASAARLRVAGTLDGAASAVTTVIRPDGVILYRARLVGLSANAAYAACDALARQRIACNVVASDANGGS